MISLHAQSSEIRRIVCKTLTEGPDLGDIIRLNSTAKQMDVAELCLHGLG